MRMRCLTMVALLACGAPLSADEPLAPRVLYTGNPGSDRQKDFVSFLERHFAKVGKADYTKFTQDQAKGYDVVIFDWTSIYPRDKDGKIEKEINSLNMPTDPELTEQYDRPTILIGAVAGSVGRSLRLKIDWR
jgi:hypothetical protein